MKLQHDSRGRMHFGKGELVVVGLVLLSAMAFSLETLPDLSPRWRLGLAWFERVTVFLFTVEYVLRFWGSRSRRAYAFGFYGVVDFLAILPFYLSLGIDLRALRSFRFLRLFRLCKLTKYVRGMERIRKSFIMVREELTLFFFFSAIVIYLLATGIYYFEHHAQPEVFTSIFDGIWWAVCTLTTVGYGDAYPVTLAGRMFTVIILLTGLSVVAVPTGLIASALSRIRDEEFRMDRQSDIEL